MFRYSLHYFSNISIIRCFLHTNQLIRKNFDKKTFDYFSTRRLELFNGNKDALLNHIRTNIETLFKTTSIVNYLQNLNHRASRKSLPKTISLEQFNDILFFAYEHQIKLDFLIKNLIEYLSLSINKSSDINSFIELINLLVLHQQKYYDYQTKNPNKTLEKLIHQFELNFSYAQIKNISLNDLSLLCTAMYRLQMPLKNLNLLELIGNALINDEKNKSLSAVDKQNFIKTLTLSNYGRENIAQSLVNRFNQSFKEHKQNDLGTFSYEIVRMTMRIGIYLTLIHFYSEEFFRNCLKLIELEANTDVPSYRAKDIIQIMNRLIYMGYIKKSNRDYLNLIQTYDRMKQFEGKPERLVDVLAPLASIQCFPEDLLNKLFTKENLNQINESRLKEKLFFISQSYQVLCSPQRTLLDQNYIDSLPHHLYGSWEIEKRKRPYFSTVVKRLTECVPSRFYVKTAFILKHFKSPDIIIHLNTEQQPQIIPNERNKGIGFFDENPKEYSMYALEVLSQDEICTNEPFRPIGSFYSKAHQLQKLNYIPVIIYPNDNLHEIKAPKEIFEWIIQRAKTTELLLNKN